ncbi:MAG: protein kinase [Lachnospiraceae bacterium]
MKDINLLCLGCMKEKPSEGKCPYCGFDLEKYEPKPYQLLPQTILSGKYILGKALGEGGFGITYIGFDLNLHIAVAIKEYFPSGFVTRNVEGSDTVSVFPKGRDYYEKGKEKFLLEARVLAKFYEMPGIVSVKDFFQENKTAYIVMEYIDGEDFGKFLRRNGEKLEADTVFDMMNPVILSLDKIHEQGFIHRDISPDNIMITKDCKMKLLDFGAARTVTDENKSLSVILKTGYAPIEQYQTKGKQGPWTDVYALCATMYRAITGKKPEESMSRVIEDTLKTPTELGISIDPTKEYILLKGLEINPEKRWQSMKALYQALYGPNDIEAGEKLQEDKKGETLHKKDKTSSVKSESSSVQYQKNQKEKKRQRSSKTAFLLVILGVGCIFVFALMMLLLEINKLSQKESVSQNIEMQEAKITDKEEVENEQNMAGENSDNEANSEENSQPNVVANEQMEDSENSGNGENSESSLIGSSLGMSQEIPEEIREKMAGVTVPENMSYFDFSNYSYLSIPYHNFDGGDSIGHMIVNASLADEILAIFQELYEINYPIEKMELLDEYENSIEPITKPVDNLFDAKLSRMNKVALADNNTFAYAFFLTGDNQMGFHAKGNAIDLNPRINPAKEKEIFPSNGAEYFERDRTYDDEVIERAMIRKGNAVYNIFKKYGWRWGGEWESTPYYHHFYKK